MMSEEEEIPEEVKKHMNVYTDERCPICNSRIDEYGFCACGAAV